MRTDLKKELKMEKVNKFKELSKINVNEFKEKRGDFDYLSWSDAVNFLLNEDADATWIYPEPKYYANTMMVFCSVTAFGKTMTAQLAVMDFKNKSIVNPNSVDVNKAMQRCLVKAIALHGIGLYIYSGEDLPPHEDLVKESSNDWKYIENTLSKCKDLEHLGQMYFDTISDFESEDEIKKVNRIVNKIKEVRGWK
jgi:hypothetical protein